MASKRPEMPDILGQVLNYKPGAAPAATTQPEPELIPLAKLRTDGGTQMRAQLDDSTVFEYAQAMIAADGWATFPPVVAYYDGSTYWTGDGFHRLAAFREAFPDAGGRKVPCDVRAGDRRDAILYAAGANANHGLRRTNADKRRSVETLLRDPEWAQWSNSEIARRCFVDEKTVRNVRAELEATSENPKSTERKGADGRTINTQKIGKTPTKAERAAALVPDVLEYARAYRDAYGRTAADLDPGSAAHTNSRFWSDITKAWKNKAIHEDVLKAAIKTAISLLAQEKRALAPAASPEQRQYESAVTSPWIHERPAAPPPATSENPKSTPAPSDAIPADLAACGWTLRQVPGSGRWYANNPNGPRATGVFDRPGDAVEAAYGMQVNLVRQPEPVAAGIGLDELQVLDSVRRVDADPAAIERELQRRFDDSGQSDPEAKAAWSGAMSMHSAAKLLRLSCERLHGYQDDMCAELEAMRERLHELMGDLL
jgi:hypothetical protein